MPLGSLGAAKGGFWDLPDRPQGTILKLEIISNSMILFYFVLTSLFERFEAKFHVYLFCPTLRIYCNLQWNLHVFIFGPFLKNIPKLCDKSWKTGPKFIKHYQNFKKILQNLL